MVAGRQQYSGSNYIKICFQNELTLPVQLQYNEF